MRRSIRSRPYLLEWTWGNSVLRVLGAPPRVGLSEGEDGKVTVIARSLLLAGYVSKVCPVEMELIIDIFFSGRKIPLFPNMGPTALRFGVLLPRNNPDKLGSCSFSIVS